MPPTSSYSSYRSRASSTSSSETVEQYMKRVGLDAWHKHFRKHLPANVKSVALVRATTAADLRRMGTKANMRLDNQTIQQVLRALERPGQGREEPADSQSSFSDPACTCYVKVQLARYAPNRSSLKLLCIHTRSRAGPAKKPPPSLKMLVH